MSSIFKSIAPSLDLCKQIPAGEFEESKLVWTPQFYCYANDFIDPNTVLPRTIVSKDRILAPAPTASELFNVLSKELTEPCVKYVNNLYVFTGYLQFSPDTKSEHISLPLTEASTNLADAALHMWLNITEIKNNANYD